MKISIGGAVEGRLLPALALHLNQLGGPTATVAKTVKQLEDYIEQKQSFDFKDLGSSINFGIKLADLQQFLQMLKLSYISCYEGEILCHRPDISEAAPTQVFPQLLTRSLEGDPIPAVAFYQVEAASQLADLKQSLLFYDKPLPPLSKI